MATPQESVFALEITADTRFIELIQKHVTIHGRLPFTIPPDYIPVLIVDAAKRFYKKHYAAAETNRYIIRKADLVKANVPYVYLPQQIIAVTDLQTTSHCDNISAYNRRADLMMLNSMYYTEFVNGTMSPSNYDYRLGGTLDSLEYSYASTDSIISLFSASLINSFYQKQVSYDYNDNTNKLQITGQLSGDAVIEVREGIPLKALYRDELFVKYVTGKCLEQLTTVLGAFEFNMPGEIGINYQDMKTKGEQLVEQVEQAFEDEMPGDLFITV